MMNETDDFVDSCKPRSRTDVTLISLSTRSDVGLSLVNNNYPKADT